MRTGAIGALLLAGAVAADAMEVHPRIVGQVLVGRTGIAPGGAAELSFGSERNVLVRPELFINDDFDLGLGCGVLWQLPLRELPHDHSLHLGPRLVHHNQDDWGWEISAMGLYGFPLGDDGRHWLEGIAAFGFLEEKRHRDDSDLELGPWIGAAYAYQF